MRILVTGGTGLLGGEVVPALMRGGREVSVLARSSPRRPVAGVQYIQGSILDRDAVARATRGADAVVHLAGLAAAPNGRARDEDVFAAIVDGTRVVLQQALRASVSCMVYASSAAVYGSTGREPVSEDAALRPRSSYGLAKAAAEDLLRQEAGPLPVRILRLGAIYGERSKGNYKRLMSFLACQPLFSLGEPTTLRSILHERDAALAVVLSVERRNVGTTTYNVTDGVPHSLSEIVAAMDAVLGRRGKRMWVSVGRVAKVLEYLEARTRLARRLPVGSAEFTRLGTHLVLDSGLIQRELGFVPRVSLVEGVGSMVPDL